MAYFVDDPLRRLPVVVTAVSDRRNRMPVRIAEDSARDAEARLKMEQSLR